MITTHAEWQRVHAPVHFARLCNNYALNDQQRLGGYMLAIGSGLLVWWGSFCGALRIVPEDAKRINPSVRLISALRPGDLLIVRKLDRAFRSAADALTKADAGTRLNIRLIVADMGADPVMDNGTAKFFFTVLAAMTEFDRERILERTLDGGRPRQLKAVPQPSATGLRRGRIHG